MVAATGARVLAHRNAKSRIPEMDRGLGAGDVVTVGRSVELEVLDTPGHTMSHVCLLSRSDAPGLFSGDRSEEHTSELQSLMRISYAVFCLKKKNNKKEVNRILEE